MVILSAQGIQLQMGFFTSIKGTFKPSRSAGQLVKSCLRETTDLCGVVSQSLPSDSAVVNDHYSRSHVIK
jgi:hypothetical protein